MNICNTFTKFFGNPVSSNFVWTRSKSSHDKNLPSQVREALIHRGQGLRVTVVMNNKLKMNKNNANNLYYN